MFHFSINDGDDEGLFRRSGNLAAMIRNMLFGSSEVGVMYDPSDLASMFQDSAGTTAAVVGQPVGLLLDKSQGLVLGPELASTILDDTTGWTFVGAATVSGGALTFNTAPSATASATYNPIVASGKRYKVTFTVTGTGTVNVRLGSGGDSYSNLVAGTYTYHGLAGGGTPTQLSFSSTVSAVNNFVGSVTNISIRELPGYHATQSTSTARPILGTDLVDYDGVDDATLMAAGGGGTTGFFLCAAVRPDGGAGAVRTIWSDAGTNTGYIVRLNASNQLEIAAGNGTAYTLAATTDTLTVGTTYVVTAWDDGTNLNVQVNSGTAGTAARPVVSAGTATATIGKDNGAATGMFNGGIYSLIYVKNGENVDANDRTAVKTYVAGKAGVTL